MTVERDLKIVSHLQDVGRMVELAKRDGRSLSKEERSFIWDTRRRALSMSVSHRMMHWIEQEGADEARGVR